MHSLHWTVQYKTHPWIQMGGDVEDLFNSIGLKSYRLLVQSIGMLITSEAWSSMVPLPTQNPSPGSVGPGSKRDS